MHTIKIIYVANKCRFRNCCLSVENCENSIKYKCRFRNCRLLLVRTAKMPSNSTAISTKVNSAVFVFLNALISVFIYYLKRVQQAVVLSAFDNSKQLIVKNTKPLPNDYVKYAENHSKVEAAVPKVKSAEIQPKLEEKSKTSEIPSTKSKETKKPRTTADQYRKPAETRIITTSFESTLGYDHMLAEIRKEFDEPANLNLKIICCEVNWMCPKSKRNRKFEHLVREALNRPIIADKWSLAERLRMKSVPNSTTEEYCKIHHESGKIMGAYRFFTPKFFKLAHSEATGEHSHCWEFNPDGVDWEKIADEHLGKKSKSLCMVSVNFLCLRY